MQAKSHNEDGYAMLIVLLVSALIILFVMTKMYLTPRSQTAIDPATLEFNVATTTTIEAMHRFHCRSSCRGRLTQ
jgi:hypothetical protein